MGRFTYKNALGGTSQFDQPIVIARRIGAVCGGANDCGVMIESAHRSAQDPDDVRSRSFSTKDIAQFIFGTLEHSAAFLRKIFPSAVDVEIQHRHG
jgi:hypothetical protein